MQGGGGRLPDGRRGRSSEGRDERFSFVRCAACGLVYLDPRVPGPRLSRYYPADYLPYRGPEAWGRWRGLVAAGLRATDRRRVARVRRYLRERDPSGRNPRDSGSDGRHLREGGPARVLDVGCGRPTFLEALVRRSGCSGVGTDFSDEGWRDDPQRWAGLELHHGDLAELAGALGADPPPSLRGLFDVVTMWHYLEHDYSPRDTLSRVRDLSGPETRLIIEVPDHGAWSRRRYGEYWAGYHTPRHTAIWDCSTMRLLLERSGWEVESIDTSGTLDPWVLVWMSRQERARRDWSQSMESRFPGFMLGRLFVWPALALGARLRGRGGDGFLTAIARPA
ncbi:MAG: class I SAM-dependent methyltransferase [Gemmatimonadetes bacterium]|nr:class I SAM-dependent methyltransferase [Gemmatimonadota bacterium]